MESLIQKHCPEMKETNHDHPPSTHAFVYRPDGQAK
jgi:hypothetical protein